MQINRDNHNYINRAVFFDRDGVLNELVRRDGGYYSPRNLSTFKIISNSIEVTQYTKSLGYLNIVISNQPDVARGYLNITELDKMTEVLLHHLTIDDVFYCIHDDSDLCECRKPAPGLFIQAAEKWKINLQKSNMIGDTWKDMDAAKNANVKHLLLDRDYNLNYESPNRINNLKDIFNHIKN